MQLSLLNDDTPHPTSEEASSPETLSAWALLPPQPLEALFIEDEELLLSASALKVYLDCPRKFFYQQVLRLPGEESPAANLGSIIHSLMEVFNRQLHTATPSATYTAEHLKTLAHSFFETTTPLEDLREAGFPSHDIRRVRDLDPVARHDLKKRLLASIEDLDQKGYFAKVPQSIQAEESFDFTLPALPGCRFKGRMDALVERQDGRWEIVDYKFYGPDRFALKDFGKLADRLLSACEPLPTGDLPHRERFKISESKPRDYQLPLYYLAAQQDPKLQGKEIHELALQIIRPAFLNNPQQGSIRVALSPERLEAGLPQLLEDLKQYIVDPIRHGKELPIASGRHCLQCGYLSLCEAKGALEITEGSNEESAG